MKAPSGELTFWAVVLFGAAIFAIVRLPTTTAQFQMIRLALAAVMAVGAVLLLIRFRWSPEVFVAIVVFLLGWGVARGVAEGFTGIRIGLIVSAVSMFFVYPTLCREVRNKWVAEESPD